MTIQPLSKEIHQMALDMGVLQLRLQFSGGSDEGFLNVESAPWLYHSVCRTCRRAGQKSDRGYVCIHCDEVISYPHKPRDFYEAVEEWAWKVYSYGGAGAGEDYGDDITYNLENKTMEHQRWTEGRVYHDETEEKLEVADAD